MLEMIGDDVEERTFFSPSQEEETNDSSCCKASYRLDHPLSHGRKDEK